uniref:KIB1-4 beta-propeller domain-containing protein n=1 Tax=Arundo donax TaxID=35708 RepID=A0A0A9H1I8_ARUDO
MYIVQAPWGDLLNVWRTVEDEDVNAEPAALVLSTKEIKIYRVDTVAQKLVEFDCLHSHVLFLGHNQSLCLSAEDYPAVKANHAYFTDNYALWILGYKNNRRDIGVINMVNNCWDELVSPQLWSNWPAPVWITPSLAKMKMK